MADKSREDDKKEVSSTGFYIGCALVFGLTLGTSFIGNFNRKMQTLHFAVVLVSY